MSTTPRIYTRCPACSHDTLAINDDKHLLCTWIDCPNPTLIDGVADRLADLATAMWEAKRLAESIWRTEFQSKAPGWEPLDSVAGIISQIDNMYAGVRQQRDAAASELAACTARLAEVERERDAGNKALAYIKDRIRVDEDFDADDIVRIIEERIGRYSQSVEWFYSAAVKEQLHELRTERDTLAADNARLKEARVHIGKVYACTCGPEWTSYGGNHHDPNCKAEVLAEFDAALEPAAKPSPVPASGNEATPKDSDPNNLAPEVMAHFKNDIIEGRGESTVNTSVLSMLYKAQDIEAQRNAALRDRDELKRRVEELEKHISQIERAGRV